MNGLPLSVEIAAKAAAVTLALVTVPGTLELALVTAGLLRAAKRSATEPEYPANPLKIVVPAHNEEAGIARCLESLRRQSCRTPFEVVVVADNCTDATADVAAACGARALVRHAPERRGKGFALRFAFDALQDEQYEGVAVVDADAVVSPNFVAEVAALLAAGADAVQCRYLVLDPERSRRGRLLNVALLAFNVVRPLGRSRWGLSAGLLGNGFALSRRALRATPYLATSVVEDLEYHLMLVRAGFRVQFADRATVRAAAPESDPATRSQRSRWEGGRLRMLRERGWAILAGIGKGQTALLEPLLDLTCLPLAFHVAVLAAVACFPYPVTRAYAFLAGAIAVCHALAGAALGGDFWSGVRTLATAPLYVLWKLTTVPALLRDSRRTAAWVRTGRESSS